jgi:hypothetical protein
MCLEHFLDKYNNDFQKSFSSMQQIQYPNAKAAGELIQGFVKSTKDNAGFMKYRFLIDYLERTYP